MDSHNVCLAVEMVLSKGRSGPVTPSWVFGHQWYFQNEEAGAIERDFLERYGNIVRWRGPFGEHRLSQGYEKSKDGRERARLLTDYSVAWADGEVHRRHRRAMAPAFGAAEIKDLLPSFMKIVNKLTDKWHGIIENDNSVDSAIIDASVWFGKATLDVIGAGAFEYDFGALDDAGNPLESSYQNLIVRALGGATRGVIFIVDIMRWLPGGLLPWLLYDVGAFSKMENLRQNRKEAHAVSRNLIEVKRKELGDGAARKDILSSLVKAGAALRSDSNMSDEEIISQVRGLMMAGHETTAKSLTFAVWELARHPEFQDKLRAEICEALKAVRARGDVDFNANDFENMPHLVAVTKETLRVHPIAVDIPMRTSRMADVLPLTKPIVGRSGKVYTELFIPAGTSIVVTAFGYNHNPDLWGPDAYEFRPELWLDMNQKPQFPIGMYGNLATFSGGVRSCLGWRFTQFAFSLADGNPSIRRRRPGMLVPMVAGEEEKGVQLPIKITGVIND